MNEQIIIIVLGGILLLLALGMSYRFYKNKKKKSLFEKNPPQDIIDLFNKAERRYEELKNGNNNTSEINPYTVLWEVAKGNRFRESVKSDGASEQSVESRELHSEFEERRDIQDRTSELIEPNQDSIGNSKQHSSRNIFSRFRRRK